MGDSSDSLRYHRKHSATGVLLRLYRDRQVFFGRVSKRKRHEGTTFPQCNFLFIAAQLHKCCNTVREAHCDFFRMIIATAEIRHVALQFRKRCKTVLRLWHGSCQKSQCKIVYRKVHVARVGRRGSGFRTLGLADEILAPAVASVVGVSWRLGGMGSQRYVVAPGPCGDRCWDRLSELPLASASSCIRT